MTLLDNQLDRSLLSLGFKPLALERFGRVFLHLSDNICLIIDIEICSLNDFPYVDYTSHQNELMARYAQVYRFLVDENTNVDDLVKNLSIILGDEDDLEKVRCFGGNRTLQQPDPTMPEASFEDCFLEAFGAKAGMALHREFEYFDLNGNNRFIDYALFGENGKYAIELNGESFHHPVVIGQKRYRSQLLKQNSLVADGFKVFRWSMNGMRDRERFILELDRFLGVGLPFIEKSVIRLTRKVSTFQLHKHQEEALQYLANARDNGQKTFLLVLPTGTGKTEIFIEDITRLKKDQPDLRALIIVPTRKLREQTCDRFRSRLPHLFQEQVSTDLLGNHDLVVQTSAYLQRHYYTIPPDRFDYVVVDEAHHAPAQGLSNILHHLDPIHLLGTTATPDRLDQQRLEKIFGEYEPRLSLEDAIEQGLVPTVRCFRVKSNIDLTEVRFNGKEYVKNDLQRTLLVPSRDQLIVDVINRYFCGDFSNKQGVVFCVDIKHAKRIAGLFNEAGITAKSVDGKERNKAATALDDYGQGRVRFLCACDLLTEGWDAPQTSILVMARPTFSRVLYSQQLGRGLRHYPGKEALYVIDVVDNYGGKLQPLSLHALFKIPNYQPFTDLIKSQVGREHEIITLDGLYEGERRIEPVDIFSFEETYGSFLNEEQLARELFVSTGTVKGWIKQGKIAADVVYPFGRKKLSFFHPNKAGQIREELGLQEHTADTRVVDFKEFLEKRDYTFSYKILFLLSFLRVVNDRFEAALPDLLELYLKFYQDVFKKYGRNERQNCPYNRPEYLEDEAFVLRSLLENPFEKFERKRFFYHCKDLNYLAMSPELIKSLTLEDYNRITDQMVEDLMRYYGKLEINISKSDFDFLLVAEDVESEQLIFVDQPPKEGKYISFLPYYPLSIAAGDFMDSGIPHEPETWLNVNGLTTKRVLSEDMFVAKIQGKSMEPIIPDGSLCLFTLSIGGSRNGRIVLAQKTGIFDPDNGASFTIKEYYSTKRIDPVSGWSHETITLRPANSRYEDIVIPIEEADDFRIIAFFEEILCKD